MLTEDFPEDHLHHRGIFWAWHQLWVGDRKVGDPWVASDSIWDVDSAEVLDDPSGAKALSVRVLWKSPEWLDAEGVPAPIVEERSVIRVHPAGDEVLVAISGAMDLFFDLSDGPSSIPLQTGAACIVPKGAWHRFEVRAPGTLMFITPGEGTQHRSL